MENAAADSGIFEAEGTSQDRISVFRNPMVVDTNVSAQLDGTQGIIPGMGPAWERIKDIEDFRRIGEATLEVPKVSQHYDEVSRKLLMAFDPEVGICQFAGGPLDLRRNGAEKAWLLPAQVGGEGGTTDFHVIYKGFYPWETPPQGVLTSVSLATEQEVKLDANTPAALELTGMLADSHPRIIVRPSAAGVMLFPRMTTPVDLATPEQLKERLVKLRNYFGLNYDVDGLSLEEYHSSAEFTMSHEVGDFVLGEPRVFSNKHGKFLAYGVYRPDDPWQYYEIFTNKPLETISRSDSLLIRIDSGCDIGQCYGDGGCDCHDQLLAALADINESGGLIIHAPTQDGRGYGMVTKMETEAGKRGIGAKMNHINGVVSPPMDTIQAAKLVFGEGEQFDIRTFDGMGKILYELGFRSVEVLTDNKRKVQALRGAGLQVVRKETGTMHRITDDELRKHLEAKHGDDIYFSDK